ncbi:MAG: glycosyltransferase family 1 protein [Chloroflexota bacterium]
MIYIDVSTAVHSRAGLGRYAERIAQSIGSHRPIHLFHNMAADGKIPAALKAFPRKSIRAGFKPWRMAILLAHLTRCSFHRLVPEATLFHSTEHLLMPLHSVPTVMTVHDLIFKLFPEYHKSLNYYYLNLAMPIYCRNATALITVSESSKRDIVTHYGINPEKVHVVYEAPAAHFKPAAPEAITAARAKYQLPKRYILHIGTLEPRKNIPALIEVVARLRAQGDPELGLVLAGAKGWLFDEIFEMSSRPERAGVVQALGFVPDDDLAAVISGAVLGVQPSIYEGFGLPVLEHMACGQVVACSNRSSLPEVGGDAAVYFDPEDQNDMLAVIQGILSNQEEYKKRQTAGLAHAAQFSWDRAARETLEVYDQVRDRLKQ